VGNFNQSCSKLGICNSSIEILVHSEMSGWTIKAFFNHLCACKFASSHHASFTLYLFSILSHIFTLFNHLCAFLCRFYTIYCVVTLHHLLAVFILHFYVFFCGMLSAIPITWWSVLRFLSLYVILLIVSCY